MKLAKSKIAVVAFLLLLSAALAAGQTSRGTVSGVITDPSGAIIPDAKVTLTQLETNQSRETLSNAAGLYRFDAVNLGTYKLTATAKGFAVAQAAGIEVRANQNSVLDLVLKVGATEQVVEVQAAGASATLQTDDQLRGGSIGAKSLASMPISGQNSLNLMTLVPGIIPTSLDGGSMDSGIGSVNGSRPRANNFMIDGVDNNDISVAGPALVLTNNDAIQEVSVQTANYSAEFGRSGGAVINQITKSGTNNLHGTAAWVYRSSALNAMSFDEKLSGEGKATFLEHLPAFTVGGPIYLPHLYDGRNKTFFFVAGQWDRQNTGSLQRTVTVPTAAGIAVLQSLAATCPNAQVYLNSIGSLVAPTRTGSTDISVPLDVFNAAGACTAATGNPTRAGMFLEYGSATRVAPQLYAANTQQVRVDHNFTDRHFMNVKFMSSPGGYAGAANLGMSPEFDTGFKQNSYTGAISDTLLLSTRVTNELRLNYFRFVYDWPVLASSGLGTTLPAINITGFTALGTNSNYPQGRTFNNYQLQDTITAVIGKHTLRFGFDVNKQIARQIAPMPVRGNLNYQKSSSELGNVTAFANFLDDFSGQGSNVVYRQFGNAVYHPTVLRQSYFVQDAWKVTPRLTINAGLRYDYFGQPANNNFPFPAVSLDPAVFPNTARIPDDRNNFGPTIGFAYNPSGKLFGDKTVIRGGFQVGYDSWYNNLLSNMATGAPNNPTNLAWDATIDAATPRGVSSVYESKFPALVPADFNDPLTPTASQFTPNIRNPYTMRYSLGVQRELFSKLILDVGYVGSLGRKLFISRELNPRLPDPETGAAGARLYPELGGRTVRDSAANSNYNGLQVDLRSRMIQTALGGLMFDTNYTWSKTMDVVSETFATSGQGSAYASSRWMALQDLNIDYGVSDLDRRQRWSNSVTWDIRGPKRGVLGQIAGGWSLSATIPLMSGTPFSVLNGYDRDGDGTLAADRPDIGNASMPITTRAIIAAPEQGCASGLFNPDAGQCTTADQVHWVQATSLPGSKTAKRNSAVSPGMIVADVNIMKKFRVTEGASFELRAEVFNIFNHLNFNHAPNGSEAVGARLDQPSGEFLPWTTQVDYFSYSDRPLPPPRKIRIGAKFIF